jgi:ATP-dependent RNA helicase SUPV3L1/SUV3
MRRLRENTMLEAEITAAGEVLVEGQHIGQLHGFRFTPDPQAAGEAARTLNAAAQKALASEIEGRAQRIHEAVDEAFVLANDGVIRWLGEAVGKIAAGDHVLSPRVRVLADEQLTGAPLEVVQTRLDLWLTGHVKKLLGPLRDLEAGEGLEGMGRGIAFQVAESLGVLERSKVADEVKNLDQEGRASLRKVGVRFGAYHIYLPALLKPAPRALAAQLWALKHGGIEGVAGIEEVPHLASSGRTSFAADKAVPKGFYRAAGFRVCGERCVRVDILERLADLIRPAIAYRPGVTPGDAPAGSADGDGFVVTVAMTSLAGCSGEAFASILRSLGYMSDKRPGPAITVPLLAAAAREPLKPVEAEKPEAAAESAGEVVAEVPAEAAPEAAVPQEAEPVIGEAAAEAAPVENAAPVDEMPAVVEAAVEAPVAEAPEAEAAEPVEAAAPVEPDLIEVWRPHRQHQHGRRPERNQQRRPQRGAQPQPQAAQAGEAAPGAPAEGGAPPRRDDRRNNRGAPNARREGGEPGRPSGPRPERGPRPQGGDRNERKGGDRRPDRDRDQRRSGGGDRTFASTERPAPRERQPDPNSPFAKLLALKAELEGKGKKD